MKLSIQERLLILGMQEVPRFGNLVTMRLVKGLMDIVGFSEKEIETSEIYFKEVDGRQNVQWNPSKSPDAEIDITPGMAKLLISSMEKAEQLPLNIIPLYDRLTAMVPEEKKK